MRSMSAYVYSSVFLFLLLQFLAINVFPDLFWGLSHLSVWPRVYGILTTLLTATLVVWISRLPDQRWPMLAFPGRLGAAVFGVFAGLIFWFLSEDQHFFGDGYHLIRSRGFSVTFFRAPVLVQFTVAIVRWAESHGVTIEQGMRVLSVGSGMISVYMLFRWAVALVDRNSQRWFLLTLWVSCGAMQMFFGHVEYYSILTVPVLGYLLIATHVHRGRWPLWITCIAYPILLTMHLSALGLLGLQLALLWQGWNRSRSKRTDALRWVAALGVGLISMWGLLQVTQSSADVLAHQATGGWRSYIQPYFETQSTRHAYGLFAGPHFMALLNDLLLTGPLCVVLLLPSLLKRRNPQRVWLIAVVGCVAVNFFFNREIGMYRDWDTLAPYMFVLLAWVGVRVSQELPEERTMALALTLMLVALSQLIPWTLLNANLEATQRHLKTALSQEKMWSPYARGYLHEEFAIHYRGRGDLERTSLEYQAAIRATPTDARYHLGLGNTVYALGDRRAAITEFEAAIRWRPDYGPAHNNLASILSLRAEDLPRALPYARRAVELQPSDPTAWLTYSDVAFGLGNLQVARQAIEQVLQLQPQSSEAARRLQQLKRLEQ